MSASVRAGPGKSSKLSLAVGGEDSGIDVGIAVVPEAGSVAEDGVVVHVVDGERPEQWTDPAISAVAMAPPAVRGSGIAHAGQRCKSNDLPACCRVGKTGPHGVAERLRP